MASGQGVRLYSNSSCSTEIGTGISSGTTINITTTTLSINAYTIYANTRENGQTSDCSTASVSYTARPTTPSGLSLNSPSSSPDEDQTPTIRVSGVASGQSITLYSNSSCTTSVGSGTSTGTSIDITSSSLNPGSYTFYANVTENSQTSTCSTANVDYGVQATAPSGLSLSSPSSSPDEDQTPTITVSGVVSGQSVKLYTDSSCSTTSVGTATASGITVNITSSSLSRGSYTFYADTTQSGETSDCSTASVAYTVRPTAPSGLSLNDPSSTPDEDRTPSITVSGVVSGQTVKLFSDSSCSTEEGSEVSTGTTVNVTSASLDRGSYTFYANTKEGGQTSTCSTASVAYTVRPSAPFLLTLSSPMVTPDSDTTPTITIYGVESGETVKLFTDSSCSTQVGTGTSTGTSINITSSAQSVGSYTFYANTAVSGQTSACSTASVSYGVRPVAPSGLSLSSPSSSPNTDKTPTITVSGVTSGQSVELFRDSTCSTSVGTATASGTTVNITSSSLSIGSSYTFYADVTESSQTSSCSTASVAYAVRPTAPSGLSLNDPSSTPDEDTTPSITISGVVSGQTVKLFSDSSCSTQVGSGTSTGTTINITSSSLNRGSYTFYANTTQGGQASSCSTASVGYGVRPTTPSGLSLSSPSSSPGSDQTPTITIYGVLSGQSVTLYRNSSCTTSVGTGTSTGTSINITSSSLSMGSYTFYASVTENSQTSTCSTANVSYGIRPTAPSGLSLSSPSSSPDEDQTPTITVSGVASGQSVELFTDSTCSTSAGTATATGTTVNITSSSLSRGSHTFYADTTESSQTSSCSTASVAYAVQPTAPTGLSLNTPSSSPNENLNPTIRVSGVVSGQGVRLYSDSSCSTEIGTGISTGTTIDITTTTLNINAYTFYAETTEDGQDSDCSTASVSYTTRPTAPTGLSLLSPSSSPDDDSTPTITVNGVISGQTVRLFSNSGCSTQVGSASATGGTVDITTSSLSPNSYTFYANTTENSQASSCSNVGIAYALLPTAPTGLSLNSPSSSPDTDKTPIIRVSGVTSGQTVELYTDLSCSTSVGSATASGTTVDITSSSLSSGSYTFYADATGGGQTSDCSSASVNYAVQPMAPSGLSLKTPASSPDIIPTPIITVSGVTSGQFVQLFRNSTCSTQVGSGSASGTSINITSSRLSAGSYTFYSNTTENGQVSDCSTANVAYVIGNCPTGYIFVPEDTGIIINSSSEIGLSAFCIMQYHSRAWNDSDTDGVVDSGEVDSDGLSVSLSSHKPLSVESQLPWRGIDIEDSFSECRSLNSESSSSDINNDVNVDGTYTLVTNPEWMSIARNIESVNGNWTGGAVGSGCLFRGNIGGTVACNSINSGYDGSDPEGGSGRNTLARHTLDNGQVIWDFSGNLWDFIDWDMTNNLGRVSPSVKAYDSADGGPVSSSLDFTDLDTNTEASSQMFEDSWEPSDSSYTNSDEGVGVYIGGDNSSGGYVIRGGNSTSSSEAGIYTLDLRSESNTSNNNTGFRCVYRRATGMASTALTAPTAPTGIVLFSPSVSSSTDSTPTVTVSGVSNGQSIRVFTSSNCFSGEVGLAISSGTTVNITTSNLDVGTYTFYTNTSESSQPSTCSVAKVSYTVLPTAPTGLSLSSPSSSPNSDQTPTITVSGVSSGQTVRLYSNSTCSTQVGSETASGSSVDITTSSSLNVASYTFYASVFENSQTSSCSTATVSYVLESCPSGYISVPENQDIIINSSGEMGVSGFCVMKYEAKAWNDSDSDGVVDSSEVDADGCGEAACTTEDWGLTTHEPVSIEGSQPWRRIGHANAWKECDSINSESTRSDIDSDNSSDGTYALISNPEWITIARNIEDVDSNWTGGSVGSGCLFRGNVGGALACSSVDSGYNASTDPDSGSGRSDGGTASLTLDNGEEIWDFSGNIWEYIDWDISSTLLSITPANKAYYSVDGSAQSAYREFLNLDVNIDGSDEMFPDSFQATDLSFQGSDGIGRYFAGVNSSGGYAQRGSAWSTGGDGGAFSLSLSGSSTSTSANSGFRCVYRP